MKDIIVNLIITILILIAAFLISWGGTAALIWLICLCFGWKFNLLVTTGVWLCIVLARTLFPKSN